MKIISLGLGVQSTALYYMSSMDELPRCDYAIFADPGREKKETIEYLDYILNWQKENDGVPIIIAGEKNLYKDLLNQSNSSGNRFASIPAFTKDDSGKEGMLRRQCTAEYKIQQVDKAIKKIYGLSRNQRYPQTEIWMGITLDEKQRFTVPRQKWKTLVYPFLGYKSNHKVEKIEWGKAMRRGDLYEWYKQNNLPIPIKSSCVFCPFQSDSNWLRMKKEQPEDFKDAVKIDKAIRDSSKRGIKQPIFLHRSLKPLDEVQFDEQQTEMWGECSGFCHI